MGKPGGLQSTPASNTGSTLNSGAMMSELSGMTGNLMMIMSDCGIDASSQAMLKEALRDIKNMKVTPGVHGPAGAKAQTGMAAVKAEIGIKAFEIGDYVTFGRNMGGLIRDLLLVFYRQKSTNAAGEFLPPQSPQSQAQTLLSKRRR